MITKALKSRILVVVSLGVCAVPAAMAVDNYYVPDAGGNWNVPGNWSLGHVPTSANDAFIVVSGNAHKAVYFDASSAGIQNLTIDGSAAGYYGALWHLQNSIMAEDIFLGNVGEAWHWMEGDAFLWALGWLYVGYDDPGSGHFYLASEDYGVLVNEDTYVGYQGEGDFDHRGGYHMCSRLIVAQNAPGTYWLQGSESTSTLSTDYWAMVGNADVGLFEQTGGTFDVGTGLMLGVNTGGEGTYLMKGGTLNADHISVAFNGDGYFTQTGGVVNLDNNLVIGCEGTHPHQAWYKISDTDGDPELLVNGDLLVGPQTLAKFEQNSGSTVVIAGNLEIWDGSADPYASSYFYMGTTADWFSAANVINHDGYYDQDGGDMETQNFTNDSDQGINLDNSADCRARYFTHNAGTLYMWRNAILRGPYAGGGLYYMCDFTNNSNVQMGNASFNGGTFVGHMTNYGSFNYTQGDFSASTLTNYGTINLNAPFTCNRLVQNAYSYTVSTSAPITATGTGYANAFENNANLTIPDGASITVVDSPLVNNDNMYAGGTVNGDVVNNDYLLPAVGSSTDEFYVNGDFTQSSSGMLRVRLGGNTPISGFDRLRCTGHATLAGTLQVLLINGFTPALGDSFRVVLYNGGHTGEFGTVSLPALPEGLAWEVNYFSGMLQLDVVEEQECPGDLDGDNDVDLADLAQLLGHYGMTSGAEYEDGDLDGDGDVDLADLAALLGVYGTTCG
jgi:hypothetical protein